jgi:hypothetical protein
VAEVTRATIRIAPEARATTWLSRGWRAAILRRMQGDQAAWLGSVTLLGAALLIVHVMLLIRTARAALPRRSGARSRGYRRSRRSWAGRQAAACFQGCG